MLTTFLDRVWTNTILYALIVYSLYLLDDTISRELGYGVLAITTLFFVRSIFLNAQAEVKLDSLGQRAPVKRTFTPWNLGTLAEAVYSFSNHRSQDFWWNAFGKSKSWTVETTLAGDRTIFTADEENVKAILATQFGDYGKGSQFQEDWNEFLGWSIFTTDGELWHNFRSLLRPQFIKDRVSDLHNFEKHTQHLLPLLKGARPGASVRADDLFFRFTLDAATDFLLGKSVNCLVTGQSDFAEAFAVVQNVQGTIAHAAPLQRLVPRKKFHHGLKVINHFIDAYIDRALALSQEELESVSKSDDGYTFLHALASYTRDRAVLRDQIIAVLLAGRDTTAVTLSWCFYELSRHPRVVEKLRSEIENTIGWEKRPTYADLKSMRYLSHTLNETLRLYPVVPYNIRVALKDTTLPQGGGPDGSQPIAVAKGTVVGYSTFILQRRPDIYPDPSTGFPHRMEFVPERWDKWTPTPWTYIPFNGGPRICIGQQFALTEMAYTVVKILQTFERVECRQSEFPGFRTDIVLQPANGVTLAFHERK